MDTHSQKDKNGYLCVVGIHKHQVQHVCVGARKCLVVACPRRIRCNSLFLGVLRMRLQHIFTVFIDNLVVCTEFALKRIQFPHH